MTDKVLFVLLDAFRWDYINPVDTPFLYSKLRCGAYAQKLKTSSGFTQRSAIYTGTYGDESGMFTMYTFDEIKSPFHFLKGNQLLDYFSKANHWWDQLPSVLGFRHLKNICSSSYAHEKSKFKEWISKEVAKYASNAPLSHIPLHMLPEIGVSEDNKPIYLPGAFEQESIFDVFVREGINYSYLMYPVVNIEDEAVLKALIAARDSDTELLFGQFCDSDCLVHQYGPSSVKRHEIVGEIDRKLREIDSCYDDKTTWIIIGDHGMSDVIDTIDVAEILKPLERSSEVMTGRDYLLFLDSTMARFKWKTEKGKAFIEAVRCVSFLMDKGRFLDEKLSMECKIPFNDRLYGDLIWLANNGVLVCPDYFHGAGVHNKGMHGYISDHDDTKGFFLSFGPGIHARELGEVRLIDVCPTICAAIGVSPPVQNRGISLLEP